MQHVIIPTWDYYRLPPTTRVILGKLGMPVSVPSAGSVPLEMALKSIKVASVGPKDVGIPIYVVSIGLAEAGVGIGLAVAVTSDRVSIKEMLRKSLEPLKLDYVVKVGFLMVTSMKAANLALEKNPKEARHP